MPVYVIGDFNIRLERPADPYTCQLLDLVKSFGFDVCPTSATHRNGGTIDAVIARQDMSCSLVRTVDVGLSDHHLLEWSVSAVCSPAVATVVTARPWRQLDIEKLCSAL
jgi:hypothetical protein